MKSNFHSIPTAMKNLDLTVSGSSVSLTHSPQLSLHDLNHLADRIQDLPTTITSIVLNSNGIEDEECFGSNLIEFILAHESIVTFEALGNCLGSQTARKLATCLPFSQITELKLGNNRFGDEGCLHIGQVLHDNGFLTKLQLGCNGITDVGLTRLANGLVGNSTLTCLGLRDNDFGALGMQALARCLTHRSCAISELQLKRNRLGSGGAEALARALPFNRSLRVLELEATKINGAGIRLICTTLKENTLIQTLNVNSNNVNDEGAVAIGHLLMHTNVLTTVKLRGNGITSIGATVMAGALRRNLLLTELDLGSNAIGTEGAVAIANALAQNQSLQNLDLHGNGIPTNGFVSIASALITNTSLTNLDVSANFGCHHGAMEWGRVLRANRSLTRLSIMDNEITHRGGQALLVGLMQNTTLRVLFFGGRSTIPPKMNEISPHIQRLINLQLQKNTALFQRTAAAAAAAAAENDHQDEDEPPRAETPEEDFDTAPIVGASVGMAASPHQPLSQLKPKLHHHSHHDGPTAHNYSTAYPAHRKKFPFTKAPSVLANTTTHPFAAQAPSLHTAAGPARQCVVASSLAAYRQMRNSTQPVCEDLCPSSNPAPSQFVVRQKPAPVAITPKCQETLPLPTAWPELNKTAHNIGREEDEVVDSLLLRYTRRESECVTPPRLLSSALVSSPRSTPGLTPNDTPNPPPKLALTPKSTETTFSKAPSPKTPNINLGASLPMTVGRQLFGQALISTEMFQEFDKPILSDPTVTSAIATGRGLENQATAFPQSFSSVSVGEWHPFMLATNSPILHNHLLSPASIDVIGATLTSTNSGPDHNTVEEGKESDLTNNTCTPLPASIPIGAVATPASSPPPSPENGLDAYDDRLSETQFYSLFGK